MRLVLAILACCITTTLARADTIDSLAAIVNNEAITCYEIAQDAKQAMTQLKQAGGANLPSWGELNQRVLEEHITKELQLQEAKKLDISVSDDEIDAAIANIEQRNNLLTGQLQQILEKQGVDYDTYRKNLHDQLLLSKLANDAVRSKLQVSEEAMREYYRKYLANPKPVREVHLAQIFLALPQDPSPEQVDKIRGEALKLHGQLLAGANFTNMARLHSDAPEGPQGGDMGWIFEGAINPRFASVMSLPVGGISDPIRSPAGFHILKVTEERWQQPQSKGKSYDEVHARHILIQIPSTADAATRAKIMHRAETISRDMQGASDADFAARAKDVSQDPGSASRGGDLGWFKRGTMVPAFEDAAFALKPGETSGVVQSPFGLHIIRVIAKRHIDPNSFEAYRDKIAEQLLNAEMQEQMPRWLASLKANASVQTFACQPTEYADVEAPKPAAKPAPQDPAKAALAAVEFWRNAWETKNTAAFFDSYAPDFDPGKPFTSKAQWQDYKGRVIVDKKFIRVQFSKLKATPLADGSVRVDFMQDYSSDLVKARDRKSLVLKPVDGVWKIVSEATLKP
ncbi:MAG TPA: peptidylprolyl isomerase [Mariprofundaceae bacterium]|nr:peptidylprolyl isomerase [Mariprofundaceae bacterium]